jgi:hypothetical protein
MSPIQNGLVRLAGDVGRHLVYSVIAPDGHDISVDLGPERLNKFTGAQRAILDNVVEHYGKKDVWTAEELVREFPEIQDLNPSDEIPLSAILLAVGHEPEDTTDLECPDEQTEPQP